MEIQLEVSISKKIAELQVNISFSCSSGSLLAITGPSGSGKTTVMRIIAGLERPDTGFVTCNHVVWENTEKGVCLPPMKRKTGYVFQEYSLFPHLSVEKNVAFAAKNMIYVQELMELFGISHLKARKPQRISGGERQRTALAQALAREPDVLLLDEPFSALDIHTRQRLRDEMKSLKTRLAIPVILVTHDLDEARFLADEIMSMG
jgi:molybdate transport system ATP-binding protein